MDFQLNLGDIYAIITAFCWSTAVILFKVSSKNMGSMEMNLFKNVIGIIGFISVLIFQGNVFPNFTTRELIILIVSGTLGIAGGDLLFLASLRRMGASLNAIVATTYSPAIVLFAFLMFHETITVFAFLGGALIIVGIIIGTYKSPKHDDNKNIGLGVLFGVGAQLLTGFSILMIKPVMADHSIVPIALVRFGTSVIIGAGFIGATKGISSLNSIFKKGFTQFPLIAGSIFGTFLSVIFWLAGFKYTLAGRAAIYNQLSTILIILMAAIFLKESMSKRKWIAVVLALTGGIIVAMV